MTDRTVNINVNAHARVEAAAQEVTNATSGWGKSLAQLGNTERITGGITAALQKTTASLTKEARLAAAQSKAGAAAFREQAAAEQASAAAARTAAVQARAQVAAIAVEVAERRLRNAEIRVSAAGSAQEAAAARADAAALAVEAAALRRNAAAFGVQAAESRASAAAARAVIANARATQVALDGAGGAGRRFGIAIGVATAGAKGLIAALGGVGGAIPPIISGFTALGSAGFNASKRAGDAILTFIVRSANLAIGAVGRLGTALRRIGSGSINAFRGLATAAGILTTAFGIFAIREAAKFQEQMATVNTILGYIGAKAPLLDTLGRKLRNLAEDVGIPISDLTSAMYELASAGITIGGAFDDASKSAEVLDQRALILQATANLAVGGLATMTEATKLMSFALNAFGLNSLTVSDAVAKAAGVMGGSIGDVSKQVSDYFAKSVEIGVVKASEIASSFATVAASAKYAGIGLDEIAAAYAQQTRRGVSAARVAVSMNRAIQDIIKPGKALQDLMKRTGIDFAKVAKDKGLVDALQLMRTKADALGISYITLFKRQEGFRFAVNSTSSVLNKNADDFADYKKTLDQIHESTKEATTVNGVFVRGTAAIQAAIRGDTISRNVIKLQESFRSLGITIGYWFLAPVNEIIKAITNVLKFTDRWLDGLDNAGKDIARQIAGLIGIVGAILALGAGLQGFLLISSKIAPMFGATATGARALQVGIRALALPFALIVGYIGTLAFVIDHNIAGMGKFTYALAGMRDLAAGLLDIFHSFIAVIGATMVALSNGGDAGKVFSDGMGDIAQQIADIGPLFTGVVTFIVQSFIMLAQKVAAGLVAVAPEVAAWVGGVAETILNGLLGIIPGILAWVADVAATVGPALLKFGQDLFAWIGETAKNIAPTLLGITALFLDWVNSVISTVIPALGDFAAQVVGFVGQMASAIVPALVGLTAAFVQWAANLARKVIPALVQFGRDMVEWIRSLADQIAPALVYLAGYLVGWIQQAAPKAVAALGDFFGEVVKRIGDIAPTILLALAGLAYLFVKWVIDMVPQVINAFGAFLDQIVKWVNANGPAIGDALVKWGMSIINWLANTGVPALLGVLEGLATTVFNWITSTQGIRGITNAILTYLATVYGLIAALIAGVLSYIAGHLPEILQFIAEVLSQIAGGLIDFITQKGPLIAGAAILLGLNFIANLVGAILRDPGKIVGALLSILGSAAVIAAIVGAGLLLGGIFMAAFQKGAQAVKWIGAFFTALVKTAFPFAFGSGVQLAEAQQLGMVAGTKAGAFLKSIGQTVLNVASPGMANAGGRLGAILGGGMVAALAVAAVAAVGIVSNIIQDGINKQQKQISKDVTATVARGNLADLEKAQAALEAGIAEIDKKVNHDNSAVGALTKTGDVVQSLFGGGSQHEIDALTANLDLVKGKIAELKGETSSGFNLDPQLQKYVDDLQKGIGAGSQIQPINFPDLAPKGPDIFQQFLDAKQAVQDGFTQLRDSITTGNLGIDKTVEGLKDIHFVSTKKRISNLESQSKQLAGAIAKAKKAHDIVNETALQGQKDVIDAKIADLKYADKHYADLVAQSAKPGPISDTVISAGKILDDKTAALLGTANTLDNAVRTANAALLAGQTSVPAGPAVPASGLGGRNSDTTLPIPAFPGKAADDLVTSYTALSGRIQDAMVPATPFVAAAPTFPGKSADDLVTNYGLLSGRIQDAMVPEIPLVAPLPTFPGKAADDLIANWPTITVPAPDTAPATAAVQAFAGTVKTVFTGVVTDAGTAATAAIAAIAAAFTVPNRAVTAAQQMSTAIVLAFSGLSLYSGGANLIDSWIDGMASKAKAARAMANYLAGIVHGPTVGESPPKEGPLSHIDQGGANIVKAWTDGMKSQIGLVTGTATQLAYAAMPQQQGQQQAFMVNQSGDRSQWPGGVVKDSGESERLLRQVVAALGLNNELTASGVTNRPRAVDKVGAKGVIAQTRSASSGRV